MAQNSKTWLTVRDTLSSEPFGLSVNNEFDIYEDAMNVAKFLVTNTGNESTWIYVMNYSRRSGYWAKSGNVVGFTELTFPS